MEVAGFDALAFLYLYIFAFRNKFLADAERIESWVFRTQVLEAIQIYRHISELAV